jgi:D-alanyl-D-alanine carboxypeptidase
MRYRAALLALLLIAGLGCKDVIAGPALLFDVGNNKVLYAEEPDSLWYPASLTKMMTAYLTFEAIKSGKLTLKSKISCSANARKQPPSKIGLKVGGAMSLDLALKSLIVKSANDVAVMLAEAVAGSEAAFVARMNATAKQLGMTRTNFVNPHGLPAAAQLTTARDLAKLARAVVTKYPEYAHYWSMSHMRIGKTKLRSHNGLLRSFKGADGMKTGFICDSGFNIIASATRDETRLVAVVLGDSSSAERNVRAKSILEYGFAQPGWKQLFNSTTIDNLPMTPNASGVRSVRKSIASWSCNPEKARTAKKRRRKKNNTAKKSKKTLDSAQANTRKSQ